MKSLTYIFMWIAIASLLVATYSLSQTVKSLAFKITVVEESVSSHNTRLNTLEQQHTFIHKPFKRER